VEHLDDLLAGADVVLDDETLDQIDQIVPPGTEIGMPDAANYVPPALTQTTLRRRPIVERAAAKSDSVMAV
jgi:hypothetical protein